MPPPLSAAVLISSPSISDIFVSKQKGRISTVLTGILDFKGPPSWAIVGFLSLLAAPQPHLLGWVCNAGDLDSIPGWEDPLEKETATHSSILAWRLPWTI